MGHISAFVRPRKRDISFLKGSIFDLFIGTLRREGFCWLSMAMSEMQRWSTGLNSAIKGVVISSIIRKSKKQRQHAAQIILMFQWYSYEPDPLQVISLMGLTPPPHWLYHWYTCLCRLYHLWIWPTVGHPGKKTENMLYACGVWVHLYVYAIL